MRTLDADLLIQCNCELAEGPFWHRDRLWWVDVNAGRLHHASGDGENPASFALGRKIGAVCPASDGRFILAAEDGVFLWNSDSNTGSFLAVPAEGLAGQRFNDGKCDPAGRFIAGTLDLTGRKNAAALFSVDGAGAIRTLHAPVTLSNGLAWSQDGETLYYIDTPTREIAAFSYDLESGELGPRRVAVDLRDVPGFPDGMTIDCEGNLWVGQWGAGMVCCWSPVTGERLVKIRVPCEQATSCCFGGDDLASLFITTAREGLDAENLKHQPLAGSIFVCRPGVSGLPANTFAV
jgi:sugar lactone lactonase YvrE